MLFKRAPKMGMPELRKKRDSHVSHENPELVEMIDETFDNVSTMLSENSVIYGSALTSIVSKVPGVGDVDICTPSGDFISVAKRFARSTKWIQVDGSKVPETSGSTISEVGTLSSPYAGLPKSRAPIENVVSFENMSLTRAQIISSHSEKDGLESSLEVVSKVDFVFCGLALCGDGRLIEVVPGALKDCEDRIIRLNLSAITPTNLNLEHTEKRIEKYLKRGYKEHPELRAALKEIDEKKTSIISSGGDTSSDSIDPDSSVTIMQLSEECFAIYIRDFENISKHASTGAGGDTATLALRQLVHSSCMNFCATRNLKRPSLQFLGQEGELVEIKSGSGPGHRWNIANVKMLRKEIVRSVESQIKFVQHVRTSKPIRKNGVNKQWD